ncbi:MAG: hypothetical protein AB8B74_06330 [Crocinitomicaceae bacterium]
MFSSQLPIAFSILFLLSFAFPVVMVAHLARKAQIKNGFRVVIGFYTVYLLLVSLASFVDFFDTIMLPPKIVLTTTLPLAILLTIVFTTKLVKQTNKVLKLEDLVKIHIFRLIGSFFIILFLYGLLPKTFALFAGVGDVLTAIGSVLVVKAIKTKKRNIKRLVVAWNVFGLVDILITSAMAIIFTKLSIDNGTQGVEFLAKFPFCFIPAFAPATIIFLHLLVFRKLFTNENF